MARIRRRCRLESGLDRSQLLFLIRLRQIRIVDIGGRFFVFDVGLGALDFLGGGREEEAGFDGGAVQRARKRCVRVGIVSSVFVVGFGSFVGEFAVDFLATAAGEIRWDS